MPHSMQDNMILTSENYFSPEALTEYFSVSQYKDFVGTMGQRGCEAMALAKMRGEWKPELTKALLIGSYVDAHFEGTLDVFKAQHPEICNKNGELLAAFEHANTVIARICLLYTSPSPRDGATSRMPSSA